MCGNNNLCSCIGNNWWWIVILLLFCCCGNGTMTNDNGCGCC